MTKKSLLAALIAATALVPAVASAQSWHGHGGRGQSDGGQQQQQSAPAPAPAPAPSRPQWGGGQRPQYNGGQRPQWNGQRPQWNGGQRPQWNGQRPQFNPGQTPQEQPQRPQFDGNRGDWRGRPFGTQGRPDGQRPQDYRGNRGWNGNTGVVPPQNRGGWDRGRDEHRGGWDRGGYRGGYDRGGIRPGGAWNNGWRNDHRYDWRGYRSSNRNIYRLPRYYAPRGYDYGYRRFSLGMMLGSYFYEPQYWIDDPFYYRLPPAYGPYRWVRYYNDALLVDIETGEVVDTIYDIFW